jgi:hypothetical protein
VYRCDNAKRAVADLDPCRRIVLQDLTWQCQPRGRTEIGCKISDFAFLRRQRLALFARQELGEFRKRALGDVGGAQQRLLALIMAGAAPDRKRFRGLPATITEGIILDLCRYAGDGQGSIDFRRIRAASYLTRGRAISGGWAGGCRRGRRPSHKNDNKHTTNT